ncbi:MAG TPA: DNA internalization-related competence protein ComEC/Rec2 [Bacillales bacterium]|nr:DNA internalization-related competence protein ComEC/Rec2 [Bacillales bacterium]
MKGKWHLIGLSAIAGITAASFNVPWYAASLFVATFLGFCLWRRRWLPFVCSLTFLLAFCYFLYVDDSNVTTLSSGQTHFSGTIASLPELDGDQLTFQMKLRSGEDVRVSYYLQRKSQVPSIRRYRYGMTCSFSGDLTKPAGASNFYAFDYRKYLYRNHIHWQVTPNSLTAATCGNTGYSPYDRIQQWRGAGIRWIETHFPADIRGISEALLFGWRTNVSEDLLQAYRNLGLIHLLAVSGLHVGLVVGALYFLMLRFGITRERGLDLLFLLLPLYALMTGASPSVVRACVMAMVVLAALRLRHRLHALDGISWAALLMLAINPYQLFQTGFQLSFLVSFTLIVSAPFIQNRYHHPLSQLIAISVIAQLAAFPILLYRFYAISLLSLPLNFLFIPFISLIVLPFVSIGFFASMFFPFIGKPLLAVLDYVIQLAHRLLMEIDSWHLGMLVFGKPSLWLVFMLYAAIFYGFVIWESGDRKLRLVKPAVLFIGLCLFQWFSPYLSSTGEVTMLDVGQGDSILIELPHRRAVYLIDTGGKVGFEKEPWQIQKHSFMVGRDVVLHELKARGIRKIDKLILTHGDKDHSGGAKALFGKVQIGSILFGKGPVEEKDVRQLLVQAEQLGIPVQFVEAGMGWKSGDVVFTILNPIGRRENENNRSIVISAQLGGLKWLFVGDLEKEGEQRVMRGYPNLNIDVLKVGHHGSHTSTTESFLNEISPRVALISVGENNMYGHPSPIVIKRLEVHGVKVLRTDIKGAIRFRFKGDIRDFTWVKQ